MYKKLLFAFALMLLTYTFKAKSQCSVTKSLNGNTVSFNMLWALAGIYSLDSVSVNWGDGTTNLYVVPNIGTASHTYSSPGTYQFCVNRYISSLGNPGVAILCTYCDNVTIINAANVCGINAGFTANVTGNTVTTTNLTSGCSSCTSLTTAWNWGDGTTNGTGWQPSHTYTSAGTFSLCQIVTGINSNGVTCIDTFCNSVTINGTSTGCTANANFTSTSSNLLATFTNTSNCVSCISSNYSWNFGDGSANSSLNSPTHTYATAGTYNVCLYMTSTTSSGSTCLDTICKSVIITNTPPPCPANAAFTKTTSGLTANFTNTSTCVGCTSSTYSWNFGDGSATSNLTSPNHTYANGGNYNVCLYMTSVTSTGLTCMDTICQSTTIQTPVLCTATAQYTTSGSAGSYNFTNTSTCSNCMSSNYNWTFGDGSSSTAQNATHTYTANGSYVVCLKITGTTQTGNTCVDSICKVLTVNLLGVNEERINALEIFPNPTSNTIWINIPQNEISKNMSVTDIAGRKIIAIAIENQNRNQSLDVRSLTKGIYFLQLNTNKGKYISSFIKE